MTNQLLPWLAGWPSLLPGGQVSLSDSAARRNALRQGPADVVPKQIDCSLHTHLTVSLPPACVSPSAPCPYEQTRTDRRESRGTLWPSLHDLRGATSDGADSDVIEAPSLLLLPRPTTTTTTTSTTASRHGFQQFSNALGQRHDQSTRAFHPQRTAQNLHPQPRLLALRLSRELALPRCPAQLCLPRSLPSKTPRPLEGTL